MQLPTFEQSSDTIVLRQNTKVLRIAGIICIAFAVVVLFIFMRVVQEPVAYILPAVEAIIGIILISIGGDITYTFNRTIKTFSRHTKTWLRNTTDTWRYNDIKEVILKSQHIPQKYGKSYYEYRVMVLMESGKKMKVFSHRQAAESEKVLQLLKQQIFLIYP